MQRFALVLALLAGGLTARAQSPSAVSPADHREMLFKYQPPKPAPKPAPKPIADPDEADQPRNHIVRLPAYIVHEQKPPIFRETQMYDANGLARLALLRYRGLGVMPFASMNGKIGAEMVREDDRLKSIAGFNDTADAIQRGGDRAEADYIRSATQTTYQQSLGWGGTVPENPSARGFPGDH